MWPLFAPCPDFMGGPCPPTPPPPSSYTPDTNCLKTFVMNAVCCERERYDHPIVTYLLVVMILIYNGGYKYGGFAEKPPI